MEQENACAPQCDNALSPGDSGPIARTKSDVNRSRARITQSSAALRDAEESKEYAAKRKVTCRIIITAHPTEASRSSGGERRAVAGSDGSLTRRQVGKSQ